MEEESTASVTEDTTVNEPQQQEMVKITDADDADLDAFLEANSVENEQLESENVEPENNTDNVVDPSVRQAEQQEQPIANTQQTQEQLQKQQELLQAQIERAQKQLQGQELLIHRQISKIGEYKKQLIEMNRQLLDGIGEKQLDDPRGAEIDRLQLSQNQQEIENLTKQEKALSQRSVFMRTITQFIPPNELPKVDEMIACLKDDGATDEQLAGFREDPSRMPPSTFIQLQRRVRAEKAFKQILPAFIKVVGENKSLKAQISNGKKNVLSNVEKAARQTPSVTQAKPSSGHSSDFIDVTKLTDAQLDELLRRG